MTARGKRDARRPWIVSQPHAQRPERPKYVFRPFRAGGAFLILSTRDDALRACPWLSYFAPSVLYLITRKW